MESIDKIFSNLKEIPKKQIPLKKKKHIRKSNSSWVICGDKRAYCRSTWEANYFRYLYYLKENGHIYDFNHEPERFYFDKIKTGTTSYLPDFEVIENTGEVVYHEVKGFMCKISKTKIKRFLNCYPRKKLIVITSQEYKQIKENFSRIINGWI